MHRSVGRLGTFLFGSLAAIALALGYWQVAAAPELVHDGRHNPRVFEEAARIDRGRILDRNGESLVDNVREGEFRRRVYALPSAVHVTGYFSPTFGAVGVESEFGDYLAGHRTPGLLDRVQAQLLHSRRQGSDLVLTLDARLQASAAAAMGDNRGAIVALDPRTGEVLALVSAPYFDPNDLEAQWPALQQAEGDPLFNRALQARYTPGSTFKIVTAAAAVDLGLVDLEQSFSCSRAVTIDQLRVDCRNHAHLSELNLEQAFAWSSNRTFALTGLALGLPAPINPWLQDEPPGPYPWRDEIANSVARLEEYGRRFGFERPIPFDLPVATSRLKTQPQWTPDLLGQTAFGQGQLSETPLLGALIAASVANQGRMPAPYIVAEARAPDESVIQLHEPGGWLEQVMSPSTAATMKEFMVEGVSDGHARPAAIPDVAVAGKTGTAEVGADREPHSWFVGFAPAEDPKVAIAVILEHRGSGAEFAAPVAREVLAAALQLLP